MNYYKQGGLQGGLISDAVTGIGMIIAFYYGLTGFACTWYYRHELTTSVRDFFMRGVIPMLGGVMLFGGLILTAVQDWKPVNSYVIWTTCPGCTGRSASRSSSASDRSSSGSCSC